MAMSVALSKGSEALKNCPNCGMELPAHARYCLKCGSPQKPIAEDASPTHVHLRGSGAIAQTDSVAAGEGGVAVGGNVEGDVIHKDTCLSAADRTHYFCPCVSRAKTRIVLPL